MLCSSTTAEPFPARVGSFGGVCTAHAHTLAQARARARPLCTLQHTIPWSCTCSTPAHSCTCTLTRAPRRGAGGRGGRRRARHGRARPNLRRRGPPRCWAPDRCCAIWWLRRQRAMVANPGGARRLFLASMAADAGAQATNQQERGARASGIKGCHAAPVWLMWCCDHAVRYSY